MAPHGIIWFMLQRGQIDDTTVHYIVYIEQGTA